MNGNDRSYVLSIESTDYPVELDVRRVVEKANRLIHVGGVDLNDFLITASLNTRRLIAA